MTARFKKSLFYPKILVISFQKLMKPLPLIHISNGERRNICGGKREINKE